MCQFSVGDRVWVPKHELSSLQGELITGTIVYTFVANNQTQYYLVLHDKPNDRFHDGAGRVPDQYGWWYESEMLRKSIIHSLSDADISDVL